MKIFKDYKWVPTVILSAFTQIATAQLYINEFLASNATTIEDADFNDFSDWVEIYNAGSVAVNLKGFYLTDNLDKPDKWKITSDQSVPAGGYLIFWADGNDTGIHTNFKLSADGEEIGLFDANLNEIDAFTYSFQKSDVSMGRNNGDIERWVYFQTPTPGAANNSTAYNDFVMHKPIFSQTGGIFTTAQNVTISTDMGGEIRYTLDGSEPGLGSPLFTLPLSISSTTIIRARVFEINEIPGPIVTHSYFINEDLDVGKLPVVSIASEPDNFWGAENGIYAQDFKPDWEVPVNIEFFENNGSDRAGFNEPAGVKINGLYSWQLPQKMLGVYFRGRYGPGSLDYPLFFDRDRRSFDSFALRASGSDWSYTMFRDILGQELTQETMDIDMQGNRQCIVYINGAYMGIHNIRSKVDGDFIAQNHGLASGTFDMVENEDFAEEGSLDEYQNFQTLVEKDLSVQANYDAVAAVMDIENFTDYVITEIYVRNTSIGHNVMAWKPHNTGKWKWIIMDLDRGFFSPDANLIDYFEGQKVFPFGQLMTNAGYKDYFGKRLANHMVTTFHPDRVKSLIDEHKLSIEAEMPKHINRWLGTTSSYGDAMPSVSYWNDQVDALKSFADQRPSYVLEDLNNYGFDGLINFLLVSTHENAGEITFNDLPLSEGTLNSPFVKNLDIQLKVTPKPGFRFLGWKELSKSNIISQGSNWKYLDDGSNQGNGWISTSFDDSSWKSGNGELGYGDGDEVTTVGFGPSSSSKFVTTYFRHHFTLSSEQVNAISYTLSLKYDDGAVVYVNGTEVARANMPAGIIDYSSNALSAIGGSSESTFTSFPVDNTSFVVGKNVIAVEIHQNNGSSSDISFDLMLDMSSQGSGSLISNNTTLIRTLTTDLGLVAVYENTSDCVLSGSITTNTVLTMDCSPYYVTDDVTIESGTSLTIEPGVEIQLVENASIFIKGQIIAQGTINSPIIFSSLKADKIWGALIFHNSDSKSTLNYVEIKDASHGKNKAMFPAAISAFNADLDLDHLTIEDVNSNPIAARYSSVTLTNSSIHSKVTGDLINVKYGEAMIKNCIFHGNDQPDTDAIDLDDVTDGVIRNCRIYNMYGSNSDAIDIGEKAQNITIDSLLFYNITDKGISVGQRSSVNVTNSLFLNCNMGMGLKDSCRVTIDKSTFYGNNYAVACFEKNLGDAGGNVHITNSILSNSGEASYLSDAKSTFSVKYSLSDNDILPGSLNIFGDPIFNDVTDFDFNLKANSPAISAGFQAGESIDLGMSFTDIAIDPDIMIAGIFTNIEFLNLPEYVMLINPNNKSMDISGYEISKGVTFIFPNSSTIGAQDTVYITDNSKSDFWSGIQKPVFQWTDGKLSDNGEAVELRQNHGIMIDHVVYDLDTWPKLTGTDNFGWRLSNVNLDNHFGENWIAHSMPDADPLANQLIVDLQVYPNPASDHFTISGMTESIQKISIYTMSGELIRTENVDHSGEIVIDISNLSKGLYLIKIGNSIRRIIKTDIE